MSFLNDYLNRIRERGNGALADTIARTAAEFCRNALDGFDYFSERADLLFGNIQSGKTAQMLGIIAAAADRGFATFVVLTTDNLILQQQTEERITRDLPGFEVCGEGDTVVLECNDSVKPVVVVLKKNSKTLRRWEKTFRTSRVLDGNPLFVLDDEADAASLNTQVNQDEVSAINRHLAAIRQNAASCIFLQVTGTPQSIFLQTEKSDWRPDSTTYFDPGKSYLGGDFFFPENRAVPSCITFTDELRSPMEAFVVRHLTVSAIQFLMGRKTSNALVHESVRTGRHAENEREIRSVLERIGQNPQELEALVTADVSGLSARSPSVFDSREVLRSLREKVLHRVKTVVLNSKNEGDASMYAEGCSFIVGGNTLGRGVTIPALNTILYARISKKPQADTVWQHARMFGYDRSPEFITLFIPRVLYKLLSDVSATNNSIIRQIKSGIGQVRVSYPKGISPTRGNVLDKSSLKLVSGGVNHYPAFPENKSIEELDRMLAPYGNQKSDVVPLRFAREVLEKIESRGSDFSVGTFLGILDVMLSENPDEACVLIVRRGRDVARGTGALLSPDDWRLGGETTGKTVLTLYKVTGRKCWDGRELWVPNIKLPEGRVFYSLKESGQEEKD